ncbi:MAG: hypothetical protein Ct9H90mP19_3340 [Gammaproteobacteria bacterium]|nr:MAG: hypothetical protein Ct9H90mP19_3340 [Gammaproteobacteria bacterium]
MKAITSHFKSDINEAHYHNVTFTNLDLILYMHIELVMEKTGPNIIISKLQA